MKQPIDTVKAQLAVTHLLEALGFDPTEPGIADTPKRVAKAWGELLAGYGVDIKALLATDFASGYDEMIVLRDVRFVSTCEHHMMPFDGQAGIAYVPNSNGRVVGLSKLARLIEAHARRFQIQERMTRDIADDLAQAIGAKGVAVVVRASHSCMCARGVQKPGSCMLTSSMLGVFREDAAARSEVMALLR